MPVEQVIFFNLAYTLKTISTNFLCCCVFHSLSHANWAWTWALKPEQTSPLPGAYVAELRCLAGWAQSHYFTDESCFEESWMWGTASPFHWDLLSRIGFTGSPILCIFTDGQEWSVCSVSLVTPSILPLTHTCGMGLLAFLSLWACQETIVWLWSQLPDAILMLICNSASLLIIRDKLSPTFWRRQGGERGQWP